MTTAELTVANRRNGPKWLALAGIVGSALFALSGVWDLISPATTADSSQVLDPVHFQVASIMVVLAVVSWFAAALAFSLSGATGGGWLGKIAIVIMAVGVLLMIADQMQDIVTVQVSGSAPWQLIFFFGALFFAPILLGVAALQARAIPTWKALYPIVGLAVVPIAVWVLSSGASGGLAILVQGLLWLGFAAIVYTGWATA